jgi:hypothetical protein
VFSVGHLHEQGCFLVAQTSCLCKSPRHSVFRTSTPQ